MALGALCMALSCVLSMIRLWQMPQAARFTPASMLPLMLFAYVYGAGPGVALGALYGVLQFILNPWIVSMPQVLLDYPVAFGMLGLAGLFGHMKNDLAGLTMGVVVASAGRFLAALASGVVFFADYAAGSGLSRCVLHRLQWHLHGAGVHHLPRARAHDGTPARARDAQEQITGNSEAGGCFSSESASRLVFISRAERGKAHRRSCGAARPSRRACPPCR